MMFCVDRVHLGLAVAPAPFLADVHRFSLGLPPRPSGLASLTRVSAPSEQHARCRPSPASARRVSAKATSPKGEPYDGKKHARRALLLNYVQDVQPQVMEQFAEQSSPQVVGAMRQTITNLLGTLPPQFFTVRVHTVGENLAQLMYSVMMTGYMFRNTQYRMELKNTLGSIPPTPAAPLDLAPPRTPAPITPEAATLILQPTAARAAAAPAPPADRLLSSTSSVSSTSSIDIDVRRDGTISTSPTPASAALSTGGSLGPASSLDDGEYAPGVQKTRVQGEVLRWHYVKGVEEMPAVEYIGLLEAEVAALRNQLAALAAGPPRGSATGQQQQAGGGGGAEEGRNELLEYLKSLEPHSLQELTAGAGEEVAEAMNTFIHRLLGTQDQGQLRDLASDCTAPELAKLLFWLMVVGYSLRSLEVRFDMERSLEHGSGGKELPPGR